MMRRPIGRAPSCTDTKMGRVHRVHRRAPPMHRACTVVHRLARLAVHHVHRSLKNGARCTPRSLRIGFAGTAHVASIKKDP